MKLLISLLLLCFSTVSAQEFIPLNGNEMTMLNENLLSKQAIRSSNNLTGDCTPHVFGYSDPPRTGSLWGVKQGDVIGTWIVAPYDGQIDTIYFAIGQNIGSDSLVRVRLFQSNIGPNSGPGIPPYPPACTPWGYYFSSYLNKVVPWKSWLYPGDDTSWHSTVPIEENSFSPHNWSITQVSLPIRIKPGINKFDLEGTGLAPYVKKGDVIFIDIQPLGVPSESSYTQFYTYLDETRSDSTPASTWIFYNNPIPGWPNCDTISNPPPGWYARSNYTPAIWIAISSSNNTPPFIQQVTGGDAGNTFSTNSISIEYDIYDCNYDTPAVAGVASAFIRWWKLTAGEYMQQSDLVMSPAGIGDRWSAVIPGQEPGTCIHYQIVARDSAELESTGPQINFKIVTLKNKYYWIDTNYSCINKSIVNSGSIIPYTSFFVPPSTNPLSNPRNDGTAGPFDIGSSFQFFGDTTQRYVWIGINGGIALSSNPDDTMDINSNGSFSGSPEVQSSPWDFPMSQHHGRYDFAGRYNMPPNFISPLWTDLLLASDGSSPELFGNIRYGNGTDSCEFIVEWDSLGIIDPNGSGILNDFSVFRVVLNRCDKSIEFQYDNIGIHGIDTLGLIGMQQDSSNPSGTEPGYLFFNKNGQPRETKIHNNFCIKFYAGAPLYVQPGWQLISPSVSRPGGINSTDAFGGKVCPFNYTPESGYNLLCDSILSPGSAFWLRFDKYGIASIPGIPITDLTINLNAGWNMLGGISKPISTSTIEKSFGLITGPFFKYEGTYNLSTTLNPGIGYWVKANQAGTLYLQSFGSFEKSPEPEYSGLHKFTFRNIAALGQTLYIGSDKMIKDSRLTIQELPPPAPYFNARFKATGGMIATYPDKEEGVINDYPISFYSESYPITVEWELKNTDDLVSLIVDGKTIKLNQVGTTEIRNPISKINLQLTAPSLMEIPKEFSLQQNYPNPFNPSTEIRYEIPVSSRVSIKIFDILGKELTTLVDRFESPGVKTVIWNAENNPSGIYFVKMNANTYSDIKKLVLIR